MSSAKNSSGRCLWRNALTINLPEGNENELEIPPNVLPLLNPSPRAPLATIQDPLLSPRCPPNYSRDLRPKLNLVHHADIKAETSEACGQISNFRGLATPGEVRGKSHSELSSAHSTPARTVSRVSKGSGFPKVSKAIVNLPFLLPVQVPHFELDEDPSFWMDHNVQVLIRIRPISNTEKVSEGDSRCLRQDSAQSLTWLGHPETRFTFDHVACETLSQGKLFKAVGLPMVENCMSGYNSCMFAYGQTGSGKTYTMMGSISLMDKHPRDDCGMTPRIFQYLFTRIREEEDVRKDEKLKYNCKCSFLEIYNEQITDLLEPSSTNLQLREDQKKGVYVENLMEFEVTNVEDVIELLIQGAANRKMASTHMNCESSRSHSVFTCVIESRWEKDSMTHFRFGRLNLVDLAGSERQKSSGAEGERLKEAANINKSLSTLGLVIMTLVDVAHGKHRHVPYRDSRLTFLLQDSLGGNSKTTIIANVSPSICSANETLSTLKFAQRAKLIQNNAKVNEDASGDVIALQQQIQKLKDQVNYLLQNQKVKMLLPTSVKFNSPDIHEENNLFPTETVLTSCNYIDAPWNRTKYLETTLVGALRREKIAEAAVKSLEAEIEHLNHLLQWREEDDEHTKLMLRTCEDKIKKMDGLLCAEEYFWEDNIAIKEDTNLLQRKIDRNPELTQIALENIRLSEKLRKFQGYHEHGEREILMAEVSALRDQLLDVCEGHHSLVNIHGRQTTQDEVQVPLSTYEEAKAMHEEADALLKESKDCSNEKLTRKADSLYCQLKNCFDSKQDIIQVEDAHCEPSQCATNRKDGLQTADAIVDALGELAALEQEHESERSAAGCSWLLKTENVQLKHRLDELHHENSILKKAISAKDTEIIAVNTEWEQAILNLTSYLLDGCQLLQDSSDQIKDILAFFSQRSSIGQQVEAAVEIFIKNENTISCLLRSLEDAQKEAMEMEFKLNSLKGAAVSITDFYELEDCESAEQVMELRKLLMEEFSAIQDLDNEVRNLDSVVIEPPRRSDVAFMGMNNVNRKNVPKSSTEEYEEMLLCSPRSNSEEMVKQANILLVKFEEAQETMKEADTMLNELMRVNETTKCEVDRWKQAFEELTIERTVLIEEVKQLKDSSGQHLNDLKEIEELVQTIERSFLQLRNNVDETVKLISCDGYSIWGEFKSSIDDIKLWFEDIWFINMEKQLVSLVLYHSIVEAYEDSSTHTNRQARFILSYGKGGTCVDKANRRADFSLNQNDLLKEIAEFEKDMSDTAPNSVFSVRNENIGICYVMQPSLHLEESPPLDPSSSKIFKRLGLISHKIENNISSVCQTAGTDAFPENMLLKELNRKNLLLQGLLFDIRLLQESMSNASDIKDEAYAMKTSLCKAQHELEAKTAELDNISINFRNLEASLTDIETALSTSNSELDLANEKIRLLADENSKLKFLLDDLYVDKGDLEKQLEEKKGVVIELENEILQMSDRIDERILFSTEDIDKRLLQMREERDRLQADIYFVNDKLQASNALANEYEAIAAEARQLSETSKVYAEQKEEEVKILERSVEELEYTVTLLERKVYEMGEEVKSHHVMREGLELELEALRRRIQPVDGNTESVDTEFYNAGRSIENEIPRKNDEMVDERFEIERRIVILEAEKLNQAQEIEQYKDYIAELVLLADAQASEYQKKYMSLETLVCEAKTDSSTSVSTTSMSNKIESSVRARGSGSPFRCIAGLVQQVNSEKDRELSVARSRIEELEAMALNWQKEVCVLKARLAATENMTYDVIRDLLGLKLDVTNYANLVDQCQLQMLAEVQPVDKPNSEQENLELREQITDFAKERKCWIEEIAKQQGKIQAAQAAFMQLQQQKQFLTAQNEMLKMDKVTLKRKIAELNAIVRVLKESQGVL